MANIYVDIPYPTPADRKDLEELVKNNWESRVQIPIHHTVEHVADYLGDAKEWIFDTYAFLEFTKKFI